MAILGANWGRKYLGTGEVRGWMGGLGGLRRLIVEQNCCLPVRRAARKPWEKPSHPDRNTLLLIGPKLTYIISETPLQTDTIDYLASTSIPDWRGKRSKWELGAITSQNHHRKLGVQTLTN